MMPSQPMATFKVIKPQLLFKLAVVELDSPPRVGDFNYLLKSGRSGPRSANQYLVGFF